MATGSDRTTLVYGAERDALYYARTHLSVLADPTAISWAITEKQSARIAEVGTVAAADQRFEELAQNPELIKHTVHRSFGSSSVAFRNVPFTLVPKALFRPEAAADMLEFATGSSHQHLRTEDIAALESVNIYTLNSAQQSLIDRLPTVQVYHNATLFIGALLRRQGAEEGYSCFVDIGPEHLDLYITKGQSLLLCNTFSLGAPDDVIYHVANCCQRLYVNHDEVTIRLSGEINKEDETFTLFQTYFTRVTAHFGFVMPSVDGALGDLQKHKWMSLFNQFACVS